MRRFGTSSSRIKSTVDLSRIGGCILGRILGLAWHFIFIFAFAAVGFFPPIASSQNETSSALNADVNFRKRELESDPENVDARLQLAVALDRKKDDRGVIETLEGHKDKIGRLGLILLARAFGRANRLNDDVTTLELGNARFPKDAALQTLLAAAIARAGRKDAAIEMYYKAKETNPKYVPAYDGLLAELVKGESRQEARDLISDMMKRFGAKGRWTSELCHLYVLDAFHAKAVETCTRAMKLDSSNPSNVVHLATTYREMSEPEKAKNALIKAAMRIRKSEPIQTALGDYFQEKKNFVDAYRWYKAAVGTDPKSYAAQIGLAQAALELQKMEDSVAAFTAACKLKRGAIREFQSGLIKIRNRGDAKWQTRFENAISNNCQVAF